MSGLVVELNKHPPRRFSYIEATVRMAGMDGLSVRSDRRVIEEVLKETWEGTDDWFEG
ncbi:DinI family protein [Serratia proteamaculans]|uniref:DinI family protein n=1 Tax=Serratia proteamaculans TaxID=28151 RepID=UPI0021C71AA6|nr:DinI family protein [Serratia proteamaculans]